MVEGESESGHFLMRSLPTTFYWRSHGRWSQWYHFLWFGSINFFTSLGLMLRSEQLWLQLWNYKWYAIAF
jgi:hypothetical protein